MSGRFSAGSRGAFSLALGALFAASAMISGCSARAPSGKCEMYVYKPEFAIENREQ